MVKQVNVSLKPSRAASVLAAVRFLSDQTRATLGLLLDSDPKCFNLENICPLQFQALRPYLQVEVLRRLAAWRRCIGQRNRVPPAITRERVSVSF